VVFLCFDSILQQLEILKIVGKDPKGGRKITDDGQVWRDSCTIKLKRITETKAENEERKQEVGALVAV